MEKGTASTYGITSFPVFGAAAIDGDKRSTVDAIGAAFNHLKNSLQTMTVVNGHQYEVTQGWALLKQAEALLVSGYAGKAIN